LNESGEFLRAGLFGHCSEQHSSLSHSTRNRDVLHLASTRVKLGCIIDARSPTLVEARRVKLKKLGV